MDELKTPMALKLEWIDTTGLVMGVLLQYPPGEMDRALDAIELVAPLELRDPCEPYLVVTMPCGAVFAVESRDRFPVDDVPCSCGDPLHWFIKHGGTTP